MYYKLPSKLPSQVSISRVPKGIKVKVGRGKVLDWAKKAGSSIRGFLRRTQVASKLGRQLAEYIPVPQARNVADVLLDAAEQEGYGRHRRRRGSRRGSGLKLAGAGIVNRIDKQIKSHIRGQMSRQMSRYL